MSTMMVTSASYTPKASIFVKDPEGNSTLVLNINATINYGNNSYDVNFIVINNEVLIANKETVQARVDEFISAVRTEAQAKGFVVFI